MVVTDDVAALREPKRYWRSSSLSLEREMASCTIHELPEVEIWG